LYNTIYPGYVQSYYNINQRQIQKKQEEEKNAASAENARSQKETPEASQENKHSQGGFYFPNGEKTAVDYSQKQIGIDQILSDFKNTINAIGTPDNVKEEVSAYLNLVQSQSEKNSPDREIIQSNLKNASKILDEYITNTLNKPSKVVEEWVNTLFLQHIDFKSQKINEQQTTQSAEEPAPELPADKAPDSEETKPPETAAPEISENAAEEKPADTKPEIYVPQDAKLKRMFIQAKKYAAIDKKEQALFSFQNAMKYAEEIGDEGAQAMIHYEEGNLYSGFNRPEDALYNYAVAALQTEDNNLKARAYYSMGKIYDGYINFEPASAHYCAAAGFAGEADNLKLQAGALSDLAKLHTFRYDKSNADMFMNLASISADESGDDKARALIYAKNAKLQNRLGEKAKALNSYGISSEAFSNLSENESLAKNYREAALIMRGIGNSAKAKTLLRKAYAAAQNTENAELKMLIMQDLGMQS